MGGLICKCEWGFEQNAYECTILVDSIYVPVAVWDKKAQYVKRVECRSVSDGPLYKYLQGSRVFQLEVTEDIEDEIEDVLEKFEEETGEAVLHTVAFY